MASTVDIQSDRVTELLTTDVFAQLLRNPSEDISGFLGTITAEVQLPNTQATVHSRHVRHDGNGRPRVNDLARHIASVIIDYVIPRSEIIQAQERDRKNNTTRYGVQLHQKATRLFTHLKKTGEGGELLLYLLIQHHLKIPQLLCKMPLKTNPQMHNHGVDGIHGTWDKESEMLALYWGESKLYASVSEAVEDCFESLSKYLISAGGSEAPLERDLQLLRDNIDLAYPKLEAAMLQYLNPDSPSFRKVQYRGACLVGFNEKAYPSANNSRAEEEVLAELEKRLPAWRQSVSHYIAKNGIADFVLEVFCLPFPSVDDFRNAFLRELNLV